MKHSQQIAREVRWAVWLTLIYLVGWIGLAYFSPVGCGWLGFPIWFERACLYLPMLFILITALVIKAVYKNIDLGDS